MEERGKYSVVLVTVPEEKLAEELARGLVERRLAACVSLVPNLTSHYAWEGKLERASEILLLVKTRAALVPDLIGFIKEKHTAKVPEIISLPILDGNRDYLAWLGASTVLRKPLEEERFPL